MKKTDRIVIKVIQYESWGMLKFFFRDISQPYSKDQFIQQITTGKVSLIKNDSGDPIVEILLDKVSGQNIKNLFEGERMKKELLE